MAISSSIAASLTLVTTAAYALLAYQTAYMKAHWPVEFMAALLTYEMGDTDKIVKYIDECRSMGIRVAPPDVNTSAVRFSVEGDTIKVKSIEMTGEQKGHDKH